MKLTIDLRKAEQLGLFAQPTPVKAHPRVTASGKVSQVKRHQRQAKRRSEPDRALYRRNVRLFQTFEAGDMLKLASYKSKKRYHQGGKPDTTERWTLLTDPAEDIRLHGAGALRREGDLIAAVHNGKRRAFLTTNPEFGTVLLVNLNKNGSPTTSRRVHLPEQPFATRDHPDVAHEEIRGLQALARRWPGGVVTTSQHLGPGFNTVTWPEGTPDGQQVYVYPFQVASPGSYETQVRIKRPEWPVARVVARVVNEPGEPWHEDEELHAAIEQAFLTPSRYTEGLMHGEDRPTSLELFGGAGGMAWGNRLAGYRSLGMAEYDRHAAQTLRNMVEDGALEGEVLEGDVNELDFTGYRGVDLLTGGPPCQPFARGGSQEGWHDPRNGWPAFLRAIEEAGPARVIAENVSTMLADKYAGARDRIEQRLGELGYAWRWERVSAAQFGVPQSRKRVLLFAWPTDGPPPAALEGAPTTGLRNQLAREAADLDPAGMRDPVPSALTATWLKKRRPMNVDEDSESWAVVARHGAGSVHLMETEEGIKRAPHSVRRALQGFPAQWQFTGGINAVGRQVGNAVPPAMAEAAARSVNDHMPPAPAVSGGGTARFEAELMRFGGPTGPEDVTSPRLDPRRDKREPFDRLEKGEQIGLFGRRAPVRAHQRVSDLRSERMPPAAVRAELERLNPEAQLFYADVFDRALVGVTNAAPHTDELVAVYTWGALMDAAIAAVESWGDYDDPNERFQVAADWVSSMASGQMAHNPHHPYVFMPDEDDPMFLGFREGT